MPPDNPVAGLMQLPPDEREAGQPTVLTPVEQQAKLLSTKAETEGRALSPAEQRLQAFLLKVAEARKPPPPPEPPPPPTARQRTQIDLEMEAGRKAVARHAEQEVKRPQPKPDPTEGTSTPVFRPQDYVPNLRTDAANHVPTRTHKQL